MDAAKAESKYSSDEEEEKESKKASDCKENKVNDSQCKKGCVESHGNLIPMMIEFWDKYYMQDDANAQAIFQFEIEHWSKFDPNGEEFTHEQSQLHQQYCQVFEENIAKFLATQDLSVHDFYQLLRTELQERPNTLSDSQQANKLLQILNRVADFQYWAADMRKAAADQQRMNDVD